MTDATYPYASGNLLEDRNTYFYSRYEGRPFIDAWKTQRDALTGSLPKAAPPPPACKDVHAVDGDIIDTDALLEHLFAAVTEGRLEDGADRERLDLMVKKFEVTKRIHRAYGPSFRAENAADHKAPARYLRLAEVFEAAYATMGGLPYLNALLKIMDTLSTLAGQLSEGEQSQLAWLVERERLHVRTVAEPMKVAL